MSGAGNGAGVVQLHRFLAKLGVKDGTCSKCGAHYDDVIHRVEELDEREELLLREQAVTEDTGYNGTGRLHGWGLLDHRPEGVRLTSRGRAWLAAHPAKDAPAATCPKCDSPGPRRAFCLDVWHEGRP